MPELSIAILLLAIIAIVKGVRIVPQGEEWLIVTKTVSIM